MDVDRIGCRSWMAAGGAASQARSNGCRAEPIPGQVRQHELSLQKLGRAAWAAFQLDPTFLDSKSSSRSKALIRFRAVNACSGSSAIDLWQTASRALREHSGEERLRDSRGGDGMGPAPEAQMREKAVVPTCSFVPQFPTSTHCKLASPTTWNCAHRGHQRPFCGKSNRCVTAFLLTKVEFT